MSTFNLRSLLTSAAMVAGLAFAAPALADEQIEGPNVSDFGIEEVSDDGRTFYQVANNSDAWFIVAFAVTNDGGSNPFADRRLWSSEQFCVGNSCEVEANPYGFVELQGPGFAYWDFNWFGSFVGNTEDYIQPGERSEFQFGFNGFPQSRWQINVYNPDTQQSATIFGSANAIPEPATWALMISGFGLTGAALRRRRVATA